MKTPAKVARDNRALMVIRHMNEGMTVVDACKEVGFPRSSFYYICEHNPEFVAEIQELILASEREEFLALLANRRKIFNNLIEVALSNKTKPMQLLAIIKYIDNRSDKLDMKFSKGNSGNNQAFKDLLSGPKLIEGQSRFSSSQTIIDIE